MTLSDFYNEVSRHADTDKTKINVAETKRVLSIAFQLLAGLDAADAADVFAKALKSGASKGKLTVAGVAPVAAAGGAPVLVEAKG